MKRVLEKLQSRRKIVLNLILSLFIIALSVDLLFDIQAVSYFEHETQMYIVYGLIVYKVIELMIIYFLFYYRHLVKCEHLPSDETLLKRFETNGKRFFMLVPQGNIVFGIISYKLTANVGFLFIFLSIALITLLSVKPQRGSI